MLPDLSDRFSPQRAAYKQWSAALCVLILLVGGLAGLNPIKMLWAAGPLLLIGLVEAGYAGQERRYAELLKAKKGSEETTMLLPETASASVVRTTFAALSLSIWPFYLGLFAIVGVGGQQMAASGKNTLLANREVPPTSTELRPSQTYLQPPTGPRPMQGGYPQIPQAQFQSGYPQLPQVHTIPQQAPLQPQQIPGQQRLPNGAIVSARPPTLSTNPALVRTMPAPLQPGVAVLPANPNNSNPNTAPPQAVPGAPVAVPQPGPANAIAPVSTAPAAMVPAQAAPVAGPAVSDSLSKPVAPNAPNKKH